MNAFELYEYMDNGHALAQCTMHIAHSTQHMHYVQFLCLSQCREQLVALANLLIIPYNSILCTLYCSDSISYLLKFVCRSYIQNCRRKFNTYTCYYTIYVYPIQIQLRIPFHVDFEQTGKTYQIIDKSIRVHQQASEFHMHVSRSNQIIF